MWIDWFFDNKALIILLASFFSAIIFSYIFKTMARRVVEKIGNGAKIKDKITVAWGKNKISLGEMKFPSLTVQKLNSFKRNIRWAGFNFGRAENPVVIALFIILSLTLFFLISVKAGVLIFVVYLGAIFALMARGKRKKRICAADLPDSLDSIVEAMKAGYSFTQALRLAAREARQPVKNIFEALNRADDYRMPLQDALFVINNQLNLPEWSVIGESFLVREKIGGNIVPIMRELAKMLRQKAVMERDIQASTASGKMSGIIIAGMVPFSLAFFYFFNPDYLSIMFTTFTGKVLLFLAVVLEIVGFLMIKKLTKIEI